jgi:2-methylaconitate cis-trans-isomerase PrpF
MAVSGGCCLAAAVLLPGTVAHEIARNVAPLGTAFGEVQVDIENPAGVLEATIDGRLASDPSQGLEIRRAAYKRSAQILLAGHVPLYRASAQLRDALLA